MAYPKYLSNPDTTLMDQSMREEHSIADELERYSPTPIHGDY